MLILLFLKPIINIFWFRRDLRLQDNAGLYHALTAGNPVLPVFIFDKNILDEIEDRADRRVEFVHEALGEMQTELLKANSSLDVRYGFPSEVFKTLQQDYHIGKVFTNHDYEPYAKNRDFEIGKLLDDMGISFHTYKDQVIFEKGDILNGNGNPYAVFTPYSRRWKELKKDTQLKPYLTNKNFSNFYHQAPRPIPSLSSMEFFHSPKPIEPGFPAKDWQANTILRYKEQRDYPSLEGTSRLSVHLRFGTISIRQLVREAGAISETFLNELIWREFYQMILWHFPKVVSNAFKPEYDKIPWRHDEKEFEAWCQGRTGYPIVDAGMRELNATGYMHNRVRMIVASFLTKHLLMDWRLGEAYFAKKLLDFELASNNGGWQWAAGSGCDAAPYFRIFNPSIQAKKFDPHLKYIRKWVTDLDQITYPLPIVDHEFGRKRCLEVYARALKK